VADGTVFFGSFDRTLYAVDATTGREKWRFPEASDTAVVDDGADADFPKGWYWTSPVVVNGVVYAPNLDGSVYARDAKNGNFVAQFDLGTPISAAPVAVDGLVIVATSTTNRTKAEGAIYSLDVTTKEQRMLQELDENVYAPLFTDGTTVYAHTMADNLYAIDVATGASRKFALASGDE
jgi:outer membrane protein assembly factor BamB